MEACDAAVVDSEGGDAGGEEGLGNFFGDGDVGRAGCADWEGGRGKGEGGRGLGERGRGGL